MSQNEVLNVLLEAYPGGLSYVEIMERTGLSYRTVLENTKRLRKWKEARAEKQTHLRGIPYKIFAIPSLQVQKERGLFGWRVLYRKVMGKEATD